MSRPSKRRWDPATFTRHERGDRTYIEPTEPVCDFCLVTRPTWEYPAERMPLLGHPLVDESEGEWAACDECHALIDAHKLQELIDRCIKAQIEAETPGYVVSPALYIMRRKLRENLLRFFDARTGPARPFTTNPPP
jgi:hypothetical protein